MYILTHPSLSKSAKLLADALGINISYHPIKTAPTIRWGNSVGKYNNGETLLNHPDLIALCGNKERFSYLMDYFDIPHVHINSPGIIPENFPILIRRTLGGNSGEGIEICHSQEEFDELYTNNYWSYWYNFSFELGVHILGGQVMKVFRKEKEEEEEYPIRNLTRGYSFHRKNPEKYKKLIPFCQNFFEKLGLQFGRLDIGWDSENKTYRIIEANTAPGLSNNDNTLQMYVNFLKERIK